jgi:hypothetical protein
LKKKSFLLHLYFDQIFEFVKGVNGFFTLNYTKEMTLKIRFTFLSYLSLLSALYRRSAFGQRKF